MQVRYNQLARCARSAGQTSSGTPPLELPPALDIGL
jgi:hypothetical protein